MDESSRPLFRGIGSSGVVVRTPWVDPAKTGPLPPFRTSSSAGKQLPELLNEFLMVWGQGGVGGDRMGMENRINL